MNIFTKTIGTAVAFGCIIYAIIALCLLDNDFSITTLILIALSMVVGFGVGIKLLIMIYPKYFNDDEIVITKTLSLTDAYEREIDVLQTRELEYLRLLVEIRDNSEFSMNTKDRINEEISRIRNIS